MAEMLAKRWFPGCSVPELSAQVAKCWLESESLTDACLSLLCLCSRKVHQRLPLTQDPPAAVRNLSPSS